jgi:small subunit ribosomal protein S24e
MDGPYHNQIYIEKEHNKSPIPLKPLHKEAPKGALNNFYQTIKGKQPEYVSVHGTVMGGNRAIVVWR